jgi:hypothetical protein
MLPDAPGKIARNARVKNAVSVVRDDVNPPASHPVSLPIADGRAKPGHDASLEEPVNFTADCAACRRGQAPDPYVICPIGANMGR